MTQVWPLRFRTAGDEIVFTDEAGGWFAAREDFLDRYAHDSLSEADLELLKSRGHAFDEFGDLRHSAFLRRWAGRHSSPSHQIGYLILVPTLRCNLACDYCQVSRAPERATSFDWTEDTLAQALEFLGALNTDAIKIEFQGGEPLLRLDLLETVRTFCRERFSQSSFVVCSNFLQVDDNAWRFFDSEDTHLSTSIDGGIPTQARQRTHDGPKANAFFANIAEFIRRFGNKRISALPTIDLANPVPVGELIEIYEAYGLRSIYLRPINRQGFARRAQEIPEVARVWKTYHRAFVNALIERNYANDTSLEEYYLTHAIRRIMRPGTDHHVDLRNPNLVGDGYLVVDYDGTLYPSDEARMMSRVGQIDLAIGHIGSGIDREKVSVLNAWSFNDLDPDCQHCAFQPYCGTDLVDDISRQGRIDVPRADTWFCQRHLALFDLAFELLRSTDPKVIHSMKKWAGVESWPAYLSAVHS